MIWRTVVFGAALAALALINEQTLWLPPVQFAALAIAVLLIAVAPRPAWVALVIAGLAAFSVRSAFLMVDFGTFDAVCLNGSAICGGSRPGWYVADEKVYSPGVTRFFLELPVVPAWLVVAGVLGWAIRRRSWRTAVAGALYGAAVMAVPHEAPIVLFAAAAAAIGPRKDVRYLMGIGILAIALMDPYRPWSVVATIVAITATLGLVIWTLVKKDGFNGAIALMALAAATVTPLLSAGVLLAASAIKQPAWFKLLVAAIAAVTAHLALTSVRSPVDSMWLVVAGVLLAAAAVTALYQHRHRVRIDQANG
ncbi:hypothetical protein [Lentzea flava]|uniref:DUF2029 domain-containing protein n=1 Tax=Lentzea flava TaxID=103732 RepID=A0ABQ2VBN1_9PSEU|nr:hypothetical protein [Lentzea flava]MCP2204545.1 hypothetical protein [Lentzea flava]GGU78813.1 hypothetical protein GCM10010178_82230 [Lentzea flava]